MKPAANSPRLHTPPFLFVFFPPFIISLLFPCFYFSIKGKKENILHHKLHTTTFRVSSAPARPPDEKKPSSRGLPGVCAGCVRVCQCVWNAVPCHPPSEKGRPSVAACHSNGRVRSFFAFSVDSGPRRRPPPLPPSSFLPGRPLEGAPPRNARHARNHNNFIVSPFSLRVFLHRDNAFG